MFKKVLLNYILVGPHEFYVSSVRFCLSVVLICQRAQANSNASSREGYVSQRLTVMLEILRVYI